MWNLESNLKNFDVRTSFNSDKELKEHKKN